MKKIIVVLALGIILTSCAHKNINNNEIIDDSNFVKYQNTELNENMIIKNKALRSYKKFFTKANTHKAFAQSLSGAWGWKEDRTSVEHAKTSALIGCQINNLKYESLYPCKIINIDGEWVK